VQQWLKRFLWLICCAVTILCVYWTSVEQRAIGLVQREIDRASQELSSNLSVDATYTVVSEVYPSESWLISIPPGRSLRLDLEQRNVADSYSTILKSIAFPASDERRLEVITLDHEMGFGPVESKLHISTSTSPKFVYVLGGNKWLDRKPLRPNFAIQLPRQIEFKLESEEAKELRLMELVDTSQATFKIDVKLKSVD
jgi:hypothetical protein